MMLSAILPVFNECNRLSICVDTLDKYLSQNFSSYEIIIIEDDSTDDSLLAAKKIAENNHKVLLLHNNSRLGRGTSLNRAIEASSGDYVIYMDVDLATDINYTKLLVQHLEDGASIATGSRLMRGSNVSRPLTRDIASKSYNMFVRLLFNSNIHDHQCGFKALNKKDAINIIHMVKDNHWFWDTELLIIAQKMGYRVDEIPVEWKHNGGNNLNSSKVRVIKDSIYMGKRLLNLKLRLIMQSSQYKRDAGFGVTLIGKGRQ